MKWLCGFSLIELLMVLSIIGIISVMSVAGFKYVMQKSESDILNAQLIRVIRLAASVAIYRHEKVVLCGSADQVTCAGDWQHNFLIRTEHRVLYRLPRMSQAGVLHWRAFPRDQQQLEYLATGLPHAENGSFWFCAKDALKPAWAVVLNKAGRPRIVYPDKTGEVRDGKGIAFVC